MSSAPIVTIKKLENSLRAESLKQISRAYMLYLNTRRKNPIESNEEWKII